MLSALAMHVTLASVALTADPAARGEAFVLEKPLTVICYNVFNGFHYGRSFQTTSQWVRTVEPDIAGWQELVGWNEERLKRAATNWGHDHAATLKGGGYNIGLTSRQPIEVLQRRTKDYWHGYLHCRTAGVDVIVTHLWPGSRRGQTREAAILRDLVIRLQKEGRQVILMGDFNAHAATDDAWVNRQTALIERRLPGDAKKRPEDRFIVGGKFNFAVMDTVLEAPLHDLVREKFDAVHPHPTYAEELQLGSFPTRILPHAKTPAEQATFLERIDFILATPGLASHCTRAKVYRSPDLLETTSDHYPVLAEFAPRKD
ncbi:MAG: endonuclease/exonuclease/phosphatase family protein [Planctomycetes bacterium]|nr:endonuclease/exonuclease/phosphatase family protein [Planctomycetota bacterium]